MEPFIFVISTENKYILYLLLISAIKIINLSSIFNSGLHKIPDKKKLIKKKTIFLLHINHSEIFTVKYYCEFLNV